MGGSATSSEAGFGANVLQMRVKVAPIAFLMCVAQAASADEGESLSGRWSAGVLQSAWSLGSWADECGPSPVGGSEAGGIVSITQSGRELSIVGLGRNFSTTGCWDQQPGVSPVTHTSSSQRWSTTCRSAPGDPRRVTVSTSISLNGTSLDLEENGRYEVAIAGRQCSATVRRTRRFALVQREGASPVPSTSTGVEKAVIVPSCVQAGPVARIEASPTYKLLRPGEQFSFRARLFDEKGCTVAQRIVWRLVKPHEGVQLDPNGKLDVSSNALEGEVQINAQYGEHTVQLLVYVVSAQRYQELLSSPSFNPAGESETSSVKNFVPTVLGARTTAVDSSARRRRIVFVWAVTGLAMLLGIAAVVVARRRKHWVPSGAQPAEPIPPAIPYSETRQPRQPVRLICPICGTQYDGESQFCGKDGAALVPLN